MYRVVCYTIGYKPILMYNNSMISTHSLASFWKDYELIDSGDGEKLERFGTYILARPEPKALWKKTNISVWNSAHAVYKRNNHGGGQWIYKTKLPKTWDIRWNDITFILKPTGFKHVGIFPEQAQLWQWIQEKIKKAHRPIKVLNLFGYTGGSSLAALAAGAQVTHVDASKEVVTWAHDNVKASGLEGKPIRWIVDDVVKFVRREIKRGNCYDAIIMDPPKFGRGSDGQVWKIEEDLPVLVELLRNILSENPLFVIMNSYTIEYSSLTLCNLLDQTMCSFNGKTDNGELIITPKTPAYPLSTGIFARWSAEI